MGKPEIRFKGFTDDWEQRKLGEVIEDYVEKTTVENQYPVLTSSQQMGIVLQDDYFSGDRVSQSGNIGYFVIPRGYFAYRSRSDNDVFVFNRNDCIDKGSISYFYPVFKPSGVDSDFLLRRLNYGLETQLKIASEGTGQHVLSLKKFKNMTALFPSINEQRKIGEYFTRLDHLITLHQRKCDEVKTLKKYMLQKMFPQNGMNIPEIRFSGFTDVWEQRKLGDLTERVTRKNQDLVSELPLTISAQYGLIDQNEFFEKRVASKDVSGYYLIKNGEFAYNKSTSSDAPWGAIKRLDRYENGVLSTLYIVFAIKDNVPIDSDFLVSYYSTNLWHKGIHEIAAEGARNHGLLNIAPSDFFGTKLMVPQDIEEQRKIGKYFAQLDTLITLHQRKCDELRKMKKFMLQNMFPKE